MMPNTLLLSDKPALETAIRNAGFRFSARCTLFAGVTGLVVPPEAPSCSSDHDRIANSGGKVVSFEDFDAWFRRLYEAQRSSWRAMMKAVAEHHRIDHAILVLHQQRLLDMVAKDLLEFIPLVTPIWSDFALDQRSIQNAFAAHDFLPDDKSAVA